MEVGKLCSLVMNQWKHDVYLHALIIKTSFFC